MPRSVALVVCVCLEIGLALLGTRQKPKQCKELVVSNCPVIEKSIIGKSDLEDAAIIKANIAAVRHHMWFLIPAVRFSGFFET